MKKIRAFYHDRLQLMKSPKHLICCILLPFALTFCCTLYILCGVIVAAMGCKPLLINNVSFYQEGIADEILRLHVIANSDSRQDQAVKLIVKDELTSYLADYLKSASTKQETMEIITCHLSDLKRETESVLRQYGFDYCVDVSLGKATFPIKVYGDITLPAGEYDALRVKLGEAEGQNWWCILFPNLCYVDTTFQVVPDSSKNKLKCVLTEEEYNSIVSKKQTKVQVRFKLFDWFSNLF